MWVRAVKKLHSRRDLGASALPASESRDPPRGGHRSAPTRTAELITHHISLLADGSLGPIRTRLGTGTLHVNVTTVCFSQSATD